MFRCNYIYCMQIKLEEPNYSYSTWLHSDGTNQVATYVNRNLLRNFLMEYFSETVIILCACALCLVSFVRNLSHSPTTCTDGSKFTKFVCSVSSKSETCECGLCGKRKGLLCFEYKCGHVLVRHWRAFGTATSYL